MLKISYVKTDEPDVYEEDVQEFGSWWEFVNQWTNGDFILDERVINGVISSKDNVAMAVYDYDQLQEKVNELWEDEKEPLHERKEWGVK